MDCGVPFCHEGCPLGNLIPDWNDLVYRDKWQGRDRPAARDEQLPRVHRPHLPGAVRVGLRAGDQRRRRSRSSRSSWRSSSARSRRAGSCPSRPTAATGKTVGVVGSGPAGLAVAAELNRAGHTVTVYERDEGPGGLMRFGVPDAKLREVGHRPPGRAARGRGRALRVRRRRRARRHRRASCASATTRSSSRSARACTATSRSPGRELDGVHFAMDYLYQRNRFVARAGGPPDAARPSRAPRSPPPASASS